MPKNLFQDMVVAKRTRKEFVPEKQIISNLENKTTLKKTTSNKINKSTVDKIKENDKTVENNPLKNIPNTEYKKTSAETYIYDEAVPDFFDKQTPKNGKRALWLVAFVAILFLFFAFASLFAKASVTIVPKIENIFLNEKFSAFKDSNTESVLPFAFVSLSGEETKTIASNGEADFLEKAKGKVILYNNFSTTPQKLLIDTRLEGTNGKIYKTEKEVIIPGMTKKGTTSATTEDVPGSIEVGIYAAEPGPEYNSSPIDFKVFGFKNTAKYTKIFGRSNGDIAGGLKGKFSAISPEDKIKTEADLNILLEQKLIKKIVDQLPEGYILLKNATVIRTLDGELDLSSQESEIPMTVRGTMYGFLFEEKKLTKKIVEAVIDKYDGSEVFIPNIKDLNFTLSDSPDMTSFTNIKDIDFSLSGEPKIVWEINKKEITDTLLGQSKKDFQKLMSKFTNIESASLVLRPIWRTMIPEQSKDIHIIVNQ
jgi:DNA-directed RNA polymerase subunit H (RpoH/RPB5)